MDSNDKPKRRDQRSGKGAQSSQGRWIARVFFIAVALSAALSLLSETVLHGADAVLAALVLLAFILLGILFDIIGVAVTAADERPFHSMAAHHEPGATEALGLLRSASHVSSFCNDVVGDICGIVSGTTAAVIVLQLQSALQWSAVLVSVGMTALISGVTIGGKALGKTFAMTKSTQVVFWVGKFLHLFHCAS